MADAISAAFPFAPHYLAVLGSKMHYVDEGQGDPILFLHGNPTSAYLWRNILPYLIPLGRVVAPDLIGMGKSDKPDLEYRFVDHARYLDAFIEALGLKNITLVVHDWGSALGFYYAMRHEDNVKGIAFMEAILRPISWSEFPEAARKTFQGFRTPEVGWDLAVNRNVFVERVLPGSIVRTLTDAETAAYREPFRDPASRKPVWRWPNEIPIEGEPADVCQIAADYAEWLKQTDLPKLFFYARPGALNQADAVAWCQDNLPNLKLIDIGPGSHFIQEDNPHLIGRELAAWYQTL